MPDNIPDASNMPMYVTDGEGGTFAHFGNGAIRRISNTEKVLLRDEFKVRTISRGSDSTEAKWSAKVSETLFGV